MAKEQSDVIRWRRHTPKSRPYQWASNGLTVVGFAMLALNPASNLGLLVVLAAVGISFLGRRHMTTTLRPRPKRAADKQMFYRLAAGQLVMMLVFAGVLIWFLNTGGAPVSLVSILVLAATMGATFLGNALFRRAYDQLFDRIAAQDGAYGF